MAITGHKTLADVERYTRAAEQSGWRGEQSNGKQKTKVANSSAKKWQTIKMTLKLLP
jgi:hypothetical protein